MSVPDIQNALELLRQRDVDAAISSLKEKVEEIPAHLTAHVLLARAYEAKRNWTMALRSWENAHFLMPNSPIVTAGKERVLERITKEENAEPAPSDPSPPPPASRGDASPSTEPPEPQAPAPAKPASAKPASAKPASTASSDSVTQTEDAQAPPASHPESKTSQKTASTEQPAEPEQPAEQEDTQPQATDDTQNDTSGESNPIAQQAQALLHGTQTSESDTDQSASTEQAETRQQEPQQAEAHREELQGEAPQSPASDDAKSKRLSPQDTASTDTTSQDTAPSERLQRIVGQFADAEDDNSSAEIETSRRPNTTSYRPNTAIIDAAASLLSRGPTPAAKDSATDTDTQHADTDTQHAEPAAPSEPASQGKSEPTSQAQSEPDEGSSGNLTPEGEADAAPDVGLTDATSADAFIPDFAARSTSSKTEKDEPAQPESAQPESAQETSEFDETPTAEAGAGETEDDAADSERPQRASYDTYDMPESRLLDELGPPPDARPLREEKELGTNPQAATSREDTPAPDAPVVKPPSPNTSFAQPPLTGEPSESVGSSAQQRSTDESAKGKRTGTDIPNPADLLPSDIPYRQSNTPQTREPAGSEPSSDPSPDASKGTANGDKTGGLSELEKLRRSAEQEARQGGARPGLHQQRQNPSSGEEAPNGNVDDTIGDLDQLIQDLESARIQPRPDLDELPTPNLEDDVEDLVSETLARIYAAQSQYREAARIYVKLASQEPANARDHLENAADMREKAEKKEAEERAAEVSGDE